MMYQRRKAAILRSYGVCRKPDNVKTLSDDDRKAIKGTLLLLTYDVTLTISIWYASLFDGYLY